MKRSGLSAALLICAAMLAGCGYRTGFLIPADIKSVHIRVADNEAYWREAKKVDNISSDEPQPGPLPAYTMESDLTDRIKDEVLRATPLRVVDEDRADSFLTATITAVEPRVLMRDGDDNVLSERVDIKVSFTWQERRSGRVLASGTGLSRATDFVVPRGESFTMAARRSFDFIARQIVERMQEGF